MSLPREFSFQDTRGPLVRLAGPPGAPGTTNFAGLNHQHILSYQHPSSNLSSTTSVALGASPHFNHISPHHHHFHTQISTMSATNAVDDNQNSLSDSLFSIHSAPVLQELGAVTCSNENIGVGVTGGCSPGICRTANHSPKRPSSLVIERPSSLIIGPGPDRQPPSITSADTADDEDNDNLLTISSLTARPLIAKSRELRSSRLAAATRHHGRKSRGHREKRGLRKRGGANNSNGGNTEGVFVPPDGGYGWFVVFGAFFVQFWVAGLVKSYGVLFVEIMENFPHSSASVASWIPAILSALCLALAPLSSALCQKFSCRTVVFVGGIFCALGLTLSYFATNLIHLFFTFGVLTGIGGGLSTTPGIVSVSRYFDRHRALANGICVSGTAAGSFVFPMLIERLVAEYGFHGTILILGGCMLHVCVSATLYRPVNFNQQETESEQTAATTTSSLLLQQTTNENSSCINLSGNTNSTYINSTEVEQRPLDCLHNNRQLEYLFMTTEPIGNQCQNIDTKTRNNLINELFHQTPVIIDKNISDSEEEKDVIGETIFMKPIRSIRSSSILHSVEDLSTDSTCVYKNRQRHPLSRSMFLPKTAPPQLTETIEKSLEPRKKTFYDRITRYLDVSLLKDFDFILMCLSVTLMSTGSPYMLYYLPAYVISDGYSKSEAGYLVAISAALDLFGRLGLGWLSDLQLFDRRKAYVSSIVMAGVAVLVIPTAESWWVLALASGCYGLCLGCWFLLVPVLLADRFGTERISSSYGLVRMFQSIGAISVPPLAGYMRDVTGGYSYCFYCMGTCMVLGGLPLLIATGTGFSGQNGGSSDTDSEKNASVGTATTSASDRGDA